MTDDRKASAPGRRAAGPAASPASLLALAVLPTVLAAVLAVVSAAPALGSPAAPGLRFLDLESALARSRAEGKFTILYFWTDTCPYCRYLDQEVLTDREVVEDLNKAFLVVSLDKNRERDLARRYRVNSVPRLIFLDSEGEPASVLPGAAKPLMFRLFLGYVSTDSYRSMGFDEFLDRLLEN